MVVVLGLHSFSPLTVSVATGMGSVPLVPLVRSCARSGLAYRRRVAASLVSAFASAFALQDRGQGSCSVHDQGHGHGQGQGQSHGHCHGPTRRARRRYIELCFLHHRRTVVVRGCRVARGSMLCSVQTYPCRRVCAVLAVEDSLPGNHVEREQVVA